MIFLWLFRQIASLTYILSWTWAVSDGDITKVRNLLSALQPVSTSKAWANVILVYDHSQEDAASVVSSHLGPYRQMLMYHLETFTDLYLKELMQNTTLKLDFIVLCNNDQLQQLIINVTEVDKTCGQGSLLRHFSTWLIISPDIPPALSITIDNVAVIVINGSTGTNSTKDQTYATTLLWTPEGREWSLVDLCKTPEEDAYISLFPNTLYGLNGRQLTFTLLGWPTFAERVSTEEVKYAGASVDVADILAFHLNFTYIIKEPADQLWGADTGNGSWNGVIGMLQRHEADMCPVPWGLSMSRQEVMDYSVPIDGTRFYALYTQRVSERSPWLYLLAGFKWQVYTCGGAAMLWTLILTMFIKFVRRECMDESDNQPTVLPYDILIRIPLRQEIRTIAKNPSSRIVIITYSFLCLIMVAVYTGNMVAFATVSLNKAPFTSLEDLAIQNDYQIGMSEGTYVKNVLKGSNDSMYKLLYSKVLEADEGGSTQESMKRRLLDGSLVWFVAREVKDSIRALSCDVMTMKRSYFPVHSGYVYPKNSPLRKIFDKRLLILKESAVYDKLLAKWTPPALKCEVADYIPGLQLKHLLSALATCSAGIVISCCVLLWEKANSWVDSKDISKRKPRKTRLS